MSDYLKNLIQVFFSLLEIVKSSKKTKSFHLNDTRGEWTICDARLNIGFDFVLTEALQNLTFLCFVILKLFFANLDLRHFGLFSCSLRKLNSVCHLIWLNLTRFLMNFTVTTHGWMYNGTTIFCTVESSWYFGLNILKLLDIEINRQMVLIA